MVFVAGFFQLLLVSPLPRLAAQATPDLEEGRKRLEEIRKERERLQADRERLQGQVHDLNQELDILERQRQVTNRIVNMIDGQIGGLNTQLERASAGLILAQDNLAEKRAVLSRRLVDIYKRGSLYSFEVLVAAESFGDLLNRAKYLYLTSRQDQSLVTEVEKLRGQVQQQRNDLLGVRTELGQRREEREAELRRYAQLAEERVGRLRESRSTARKTEQRLSQLEIGRASCRERV
jgi:septal ring factor EnvC (AmiA/AmiB activator)